MASKPAERRARLPPWWPRVAWGAALVLWMAAGSPWSPVLSIFLALGVNCLFVGALGYAYWTGAHPVGSMRWGYASCGLIVCTGLWWGHNLGDIANTVGPFLFVHLALGIFGVAGSLAILETALHDLNRKRAAVLVAGALALFSFATVTNGPETAFKAWMYLSLLISGAAFLLGFTLMDMNPEVLPREELDEDSGIERS